MDEHEPLCAACGAACNAITGAQGQRWALNTAHHTLTGTVYLSEYEAIAMGTEAQALVVAVVRPALLAEVARDFPCQLPPCPLRRVQDRAANHGCVQYPAGYDPRG